MTWKGDKAYRSFECDLIISCGFCIGGLEQSMAMAVLGLMHPTGFIHVE